MSKKNAYRLIVLLFIITIILGFNLKNLKFNYVFESFFPEKDPALEYYHEFEKEFGNDNNFLLIGIENTPSIFDSTFLKQLNHFSENLDSIAHIERVISLTSIQLPVISKAGFFNVPLVHLKQPALLSKDSARIFESEQFTEKLISKNSQATALIIQHAELQSKPATDSLVNNIEQLINSYAFEKTHFAGRVYAQGVFIEKMQTELMVFLSASVVLVIVFLFLCFRSFSGVIIPLIVVMLSTVWILGIMGLTGKRLDILMVLLPTIMFVVGMSDVVHLYTKYIELLRSGLSKIDAIKITVKEVGLATFLTSLTTAIGFFTLITATISPIQEFGLYTGIGVFVAFIVTFTLMPALLLILKKPKITKVNRHNIWQPLVEKMFIFTLKRRKKVFAINLLIIVLSLFGLYQVKINSYLIDDLPDNAPLKVDFRFFDKYFGGSRPFEITATVTSDSLNVFSPDIIKKIALVENYLKSDFGAGNIISPTIIIKGVNQALHGGNPKYFILPASQREWKQVNKYLRRITKRKQDQKLFSEDLKTARISMRTGDVGSAITLENTKNFYQYTENMFSANNVSFRVTGTSNLIDRNNEYLAQNMFKGLGIAFLVVATIAGLLFKSIRMVLITLIPNIIPLMIVGAIMGIADINLKMSTSIIFTIAFGIAVDDTIHFTSKFKIELAKGKNLLYALKRTYLSTGKAIIITSLILSGGFLILLLSTFGGTFYTGLLISLTLVFALVIDLTLLPVLILYFYKKAKANNQHK